MFRKLRMMSYIPRSDLGHDNDHYQQNYDHPLHVTLSLNHNTRVQHYSTRVSGPHRVRFLCVEWSVEWLFKWCRSDSCRVTVGTLLRHALSYMTSPAARRPPPAAQTSFQDAHATTRPSFRIRIRRALPGNKLF